MSARRRGLPLTYEFGKRFGIYGLLLALTSAAALFVDEFRSFDNLGNIVKQSAVLAALAIGQTFVVVAGLIDLSVGMLSGLVVVISCDLMNGSPAMTVTALTLVLVLALASSVGLLTGILNNILRIHPLILTFGMLSILQSAIFLYTDRSIGRVSPAIDWLANGELFGLPVAALVLLAVALPAHVLLRHSRYGYQLYAVGGNTQSARRAGIDVERVKLLAFVLSGLSAGIGGVLLAGRLGTGYPNAGVGLELDAIVAVVLGGATLAGGRGTIPGSVAAVFVLGVSNNILNLMEVSAFVQMLIKGLIVIGAVLLSQPQSKDSRG